MCSHQITGIIQSYWLKIENLSHKIFNGIYNISSIASDLNNVLRRDIHFQVVLAVSLEKYKPYQKSCYHKDSTEADTSTPKFSHFSIRTVKQFNVVLLVLKQESDIMKEL